MKLTAKGKRYVTSIIVIVCAIVFVSLIAKLPNDADIYRDSDMIRAEASTWESYVVSIGGNPYTE